MYTWVPTMFFWVHKSANGVLLCSQLVFNAQEYIMTNCVHKSTRHILLWELWKHSWSFSEYSNYTLTSVKCKSCYRIMYFIKIGTLLFADFHWFSKLNFWFKPAYLKQIKTKINVLYIKIYVSSLGIKTIQIFEIDDLVFMLCPLNKAFFDSPGAVANKYWLDFRNSFQT